MPVSGAEHLRRLRPALGTYVEIGVPASSMAVTAVSAAFARVEHLHRALSFQDPDSELTRLNRANGAGVSISRVVERVLRIARAMTRVSRGLFNCTVGGALVERGLLPDPGVGAMIPFGVAEDIEIEAGIARLRRPVLVTLDGVAKGFAVDLAVQALRQCGAISGWVNAGGDMRVFGDFTLPVIWRDYAWPGSGLRNAALATSTTGACFDASFPAAIIDGRTTNASRRQVTGNWSVLSHAAWRADALTKVAANADDASRASCIERLGGRLIFGSAR